MRAAKYLGPVVTADAVCLSVGDGSLNVLTVEREREPFKGQRALPGVYVNAGETISQAVTRCLAAKAGLTLPTGAYRKIVDVYDSLDRDPRGHSLSVVSVIAVGDAEHSGQWAPVGDELRLAFDHDEIVRKARSWVDTNVWNEPALLGALMADRELSTANLVDVFESIEGQPINVSNLRRRLIASMLLEPTDSVASPTGRGRPSTMWRWRD